jgi:hypothetical protein
VERVGERLGFEGGDGKYIYEWLWAEPVLDHVSPVVVSCTC